MLSCAQFRACHFTICYVRSVFYATCPTRVLEYPHLQSTPVSLHPLLWLNVSNIDQVCPECPFGSMTLRHHQAHSHTYKFATSNCSLFSCSRTNDSLQPVAMPNMLTTPGASRDQLSRLEGRSTRVYSNPVTLSPTLNGCRPRQHPQEISVLKSHYLDLHAHFPATPQPHHKMLHRAHYVDLL